MNSFVGRPWRWRLNTRLAFILIFAASILALSLFLSYFLARHQALSQETRHLELLSNEVHTRMVMTRSQFRSVVQHFSQTTKEQPCAPAVIQDMQQYDLGGFFLKGVAHIKNDVIQCSSIPGLLDGISLGKPINVEEDGTRVWTGVTLPSWHNQSFIILEKSGWAVLIVPHHAIEALGDPDVSLAIISVITKKTFAVRGKISQDWIDRYDGVGTDLLFDREMDMLVHITPTGPRRSIVIAALPGATIEKTTKEFALMFLPFGGLIGLVLAGCVLVIAKHRYSPKATLIKALVNDEFYVEYQPIMDVHTQTCVGAEALIRWKTSDGKNMPPDYFIPIAESQGLICQITARIIHLVAIDMKEFFASDPNFHISINVSSHDLMSENFLEIIHEFLKISEAKSTQVVLEITERGFLNDDRSLNTMKELRQLGIQIAIDDFGTGYSNLSYLTKFDLDFLKIDKAFVDTMGSGAVTSNVVFHIIEMAKSLNIEMIAEGVETIEQSDLLQCKGVKYIQGWLYSKSISPTDLIIFKNRV